MLLEKLKASNVWDPRYDLPLCPAYNNPWLYMAYAQLCLLRAGESLNIPQIDDFFKQCEAGAAKPHESGLFARWPFGSDQTSHDEVLGAAFLSPWIAERILRHLDQTDGEFDPMQIPKQSQLQWNVFRFPFVRPYLQACSERNVSEISEAIFASHLGVDGITRKPDDHGGVLRNWLMAEKMNEHNLAGAARSIWIIRIHLLGMTPKGSLSVEPGENGRHPIYAEIAPEAW